MPRTRVDKTAYMITRFNDYVRGELKRLKKPQKALADYLGISRPSLSLRLLGEVKWTMEEVLETFEFLEFDTLEFNTYLLTKGETKCLSKK